MLVFSGHKLCMHTVDKGLPYYPLRLHALKPTYAAGNRTERGLEAKLSIYRYSVIYQIQFSVRNSVVLISVFSWM